MVKTWRTLQGKRGKSFRPAACFLPSLSRTSESRMLLALCNSKALVWSPPPERQRTTLAEVSQLPEGMPFSLIDRPRSGLGTHTAATP
jgi:hypothetical protein